MIYSFVQCFLIASNNYYQRQFDSDVKSPTRFSRMKQLNVNWNSAKIIPISSLPRTAYMPRWIGSALAQIMACSAPSHYQIQFWVIVNRTLRKKLKWNFNQNTKLRIHENASENVVCEMAPFCLGHNVLKIDDKSSLVQTRACPWDPYVAI